jgi:hypothetical protein
MKWIKGYRAWRVDEQGDPYGLPPLNTTKGVTVDNTAYMMPPNKSLTGRSYAVGNEEYFMQLRTLSPDEVRKKEEFAVGVTAFAAGFIPFIGPFISAGILAGEAHRQYTQYKDKEAAAKNAFWAAVSLAIPGLSMLKHVPRLGQAGIKALQTKLDKGEKLYTSLELYTSRELMAMEEIKKNPELVGNAITKALADKGVNLKDKGIDLASAAKSAFYRADKRI